MRNPLLKPSVIAALTAAVAGAWLVGCGSDSDSDEDDQLVTPAERARAEGGELLGVFQGRVPCAAAELPISPMPSPTPRPDGCQRVKVKLDLYHDSEGVPTTYILFRIYVGQGDDVTTTVGE